MGLNIVALLISGVAGVIVARGVTRPVIELSEGVQRINKGDYRCPRAGQNTGRTWRPGFRVQRDGSRTPGTR